MNESATEEAVRRFPIDVAEHRLTIVKQDGVYRHLRCSKPGTGVMSFNIVTWPGFLAYTGDMGEFMFSRVNDMFTFFRAHEGDDGIQRINPDYWAEKCLAAHPNGKGIQEFDVKKFRAALMRDAREYLELDDGTELPADTLEELEQLLRADDEFDCISAIRDFHSDIIKLDDWWEHDFNSWTFRYIWCCLAIVWAIDRFDEATKTEAQE